MLKTINTKFIFFTIIFIILGVGIPTTFLISQFRENFDQRSRIMLESTVDVVNSCLNNAMMLNRQKNIPEILKSIENNRSVDHIRIFTKEGTISYASNPEEVGKNIDFLAPGHTFRGNTNGHNTVIIDDKNIYSVTTPILNKPICRDCHATEGDIIAFVDVDTELTKAEIYFYTGSLHMIFLALAMILILFIGFYLLFHHFINKPLSRFRTALDEVEKGNLEMRLPAAKVDEIGILEGHFNNMVTNLKTSKQKIDEMHFEQLQRADKLVTLGELAAEMAHEINNPAGIIMSRVDYVQMGLKEKPEFKKYDEDLSVVQNQIEKISRITGSILKYSKKLPKEFRTVNLQEITEETLQILGPRLAKYNVIVDKHFLSARPETQGDAVQLEQVFTNLVNNAIDAIRDDGQLSIGIEDTDDQRLHWYIRDNGIGMDKKTSEQIFNPFFTTKASDKGTGLGLYIVKNICKNHKAEIYTQSETGKGTTFYLYFQVNESI